MAQNTIDWVIKTIIDSKDYDSFLKKVQSDKPTLQLSVKGLSDLGEVDTKLDSVKKKIDNPYALSVDVTSGLVNVMKLEAAIKGIEKATAKDYSLNFKGGIGTLNSFEKMGSQISREYDKFINYQNGTNSNYKPYALMQQGANISAGAGGTGYSAGLSQNWGNIQSQMTKSQEISGKFNDNIQKAGLNAGDLAGRVGGVATGVNRVNKNTNQMNRNISQSSSNWSLFARNATNALGGVNDSLGGILVTLGAANTSYDMFQQSLSLESQEAVLGLSRGSANAKSLVDTMANVTKDLPYDRSTMAIMSGSLLQDPQQTNAQTQFIGELTAGYMGYAKAIYGAATNTYQMELEVSRFINSGDTMAMTRSGPFMAWKDDLDEIVKKFPAADQAYERAEAFKELFQSKMGFDITGIAKLNTAEILMEKVRGNIEMTTAQVLKSGLLPTIEAITTGFLDLNDASGGTLAYLTGIGIIGITIAGALGFLAGPIGTTISGLFSLMKIIRGVEGVSRIAALTNFLLGRSLDYQAKKTIEAGSASLYKAEADAIETAGDTADVAGNVAESTSMLGTLGKLGTLGGIGKGLASIGGGTVLAGAGIGATILLTTAFIEGLRLPLSRLVALGKDKGLNKANIQAGVDVLKEGAIVIVPIMTAVGTLMAGMSLISGGGVGFIAGGTALIGGGALSAAAIAIGLGLATELIWGMRYPLYQVEALGKLNYNKKKLTQGAETIKTVGTFIGAIATNGIQLAGLGTIALFANWLVAAGKAEIPLLIKTSNDIAVQINKGPIVGVKGAEGKAKNIESIKKFVDNISSIAGNLVPLGAIALFANWLVLAGKLEIPILIKTNNDVAKQINEKDAIYGITGAEGKIKNLKSVKDFITQLNGIGTELSSLSTSGLSGGLKGQSGNIIPDFLTNILGNYVPTDGGASVMLDKSLTEAQQIVGSINTHPIANITNSDLTTKLTTVKWYTNSLSQLANSLTPENVQRISALGADNISQSFDVALTEVQQIVGSINTHQVVLPNNPFLIQSIDRIKWYLNGLGSLKTSFDTNYGSLMGLGSTDYSSILDLALSEVQQMVGSVNSHKIVEITNSFGTTLGTMISIIGEKLPQFQQGGSTLGKGFVDRFKYQAGFLQWRARSVIDDAIKVANAKASAFWTAGAKIGNSFVRGFLDASEIHSPGLIQTKVVGELNDTLNYIRGKASAFWTAGASLGAFAEMPTFNYNVERKKVFNSNFGSAFSGSDFDLKMPNNVINVNIGGREFYDFTHSVEQERKAIDDARY